MSELEKKVHLIKVATMKPGQKDWQPGQEVDLRIVALAFVAILLALFVWVM